MENYNEMTKIFVVIGNGKATVCSTCSERDKLLREDRKAVYSFFTHGDAAVNYMEAYFYELRHPSPPSPTPIHRDGLLVKCSSSAIGFSFTVIDKRSGRVIKSERSKEIASSNLAGWLGIVAACEYGVSIGQPSLTIRCSCNVARAWANRKKTNCNVSISPELRHRIKNAEVWLAKYGQKFKFKND